MDILFVAGLKMGVAGVAWATFLCQGVSCVLAMVVVFRRIGAFKSTHKVVLFSWNMLGKVAVVAIPSILQQSFVSVGNIILQSVINTFGASVIAGYSAAVKLNNMVITSFTTLGNGISNYTSQNMRGQDGPCAQGLWRRPQSGVDHLRAHRAPVLLLRPFPAAAVHE